jgi:hypothetical protein
MEKNYTIERINLEGLTQKQIDLLKLLNASCSSYVKEHPDSIMGYDQICDHDDAYMCECRLQYFADRLKETQCDRPGEINICVS